MNIQYDVVYPCPCCGYYTICNYFEICSVCFWQVDNIGGEDEPDVQSGANGITLNQARKNYQAFKSSKERFMNSVREPLADELPENNVKIKLPPF